MSELVGHAYHNPGAREFKDFRVVPTNHGQDMLLSAAMTHDIITQALVSQFANTLSKEWRSEIIASRYGEKIGAEVEKLGRHMAEDAGQPNGPLYLHAEIPSPIIETPGAYMMTGVGKAKFADARPVGERLADPEGAKNLADIGGIYVQPELPGMIGSMQGQGQGSAIARSMLDRYPADMPAVIYEYPELNPRIVPLIESLGFRAVRERPDTFLGIETPQELYAGPLCGDLIETLETRQPWLRDRELISLERQG